MEGHDGIFEEIEGAVPLHGQLLPQPDGGGLGAASEEEALDCYRRVRDEIRAFVETLPDAFECQ